MNRFELRYQDYSLSPEQESLRTSIRTFLARHCPSDVVRAAEPSGYDADLWRLCVEMGLASMPIPATHGGDDASLVDLVLVAEELGRALAPVPFISHAVTGRMLASAGADPDLVKAAIAGTPMTTALRPVLGDGAVLVQDAAIAGHLVSLTDAGLTTYAEPAAVPAPSQGASALGWWSTGSGQPSLLTTGTDAARLHEDATMEWRLLTAAALVGLTESALSLAVEFATTRHTLGVPIGSLQGVSFPLADIAIGVAGARNLVWRAAWLREHEPETDPHLALAAFAYAGQVATHAVEVAQHTHGGLGFTIEADISLYFLRAKAWQLPIGDVAGDIRRIGEALLTGTKHDESGEGS